MKEPVTWGLVWVGQHAQSKKIMTVTFKIKWLAAKEHFTEWAKVRPLFCQKGPGTETLYS